MPDSDGDRALATTLNIESYSDALVVLGTAGILMPIVRRLGVNPVVGFLAAGAALGPLGLGSFVQSFPGLFWVTITNSANVSGIAEFGVVFLLFLIGLEMTFERLNGMRRAILGLGGSQWLLTAVGLGGILYALGVDAAAAVVVAACLALSSTAIVIEILSNQARMSTGSGRASFAILLAQDLAAIPLLILIAMLGVEGAALAQTIGLAFLKAALALGAIVLFGRVLLRPMFRLVAGANSPELFIAAILFVIVATGVVAAEAGLSMALGAFVAGLVLAETEFRRGIEALVKPFKGLLLGVFFFTVGMMIDVRAIVSAPMAILGAVAALLFLKAAITAAVLAAAGQPRSVVIETALLLAPGGELGVVGIGAAQAANIINAEAASRALLVIVLSMALTPLLGYVGRKVVMALTPAAEPDPETAIAPPRETRHAIVVGHGRVGRVVCDLLERHKVPYLAVDSDARAVALDRRRGQAVYFGDATDPAFLELCNLKEAAAVVVTIHTSGAIERLAAAVRSTRPDIPIISRARDAAHASRLYRLGVTDAVPETIEASLQLSEAALAGIGVPMGHVIASIHEKRDEFRAELQAAAREAGQETTRAVRAKSSG
jgi:monovalent cation:H+ antiporter-2, CPA2 family